MRELTGLLIVFFTGVGAGWLLHRTVYEWRIERALKRINRRLMNDHGRRVLARESVNATMARSEGANI